MDISSTLYIPVASSNILNYILFHTVYPPLMSFDINCTYSHVIVSILNSFFCERTHHFIKNSDSK